MGGNINEGANTFWGKKNDGARTFLQKNNDGAKTFYGMNSYNSHEIYRKNTPAARGVLGLLSDRGVPPLNSKMGPFLGRKKSEKAPISRNFDT